MTEERGGSGLRTLARGRLSVDRRTLAACHVALVFGTDGPNRSRSSATDSTAVVT